MGKRLWRTPPIEEGGLQFRDRTQLKENLYRGPRPCLYQHSCSTEISPQDLLNRWKDLEKKKLPQAFSDLGRHVVGQWKRQQQTGARHHPASGETPDNPVVILDSSGNIYRR